MPEDIPVGNYLGFLTQVDDERSVVGVHLHLLGILVCIDGLADLCSRTHVLMHAF